jgi:broad specificity phosphatase PhoE
MVIITLRHAVPDYSLPTLDPPLSARGGLQAHITARTLGLEGIKTVFSSPFRRTTETAACVTEVLCLPVEAAPMLSETFAFDFMKEFHGFTRTQLANSYPFVTFPPDFPEDDWWPPWPETEEDVDRRLAEWARRLAQRFRRVEDVILNVGHGASCKSLIKAFVPASDLPGGDWGHTFCGYSRVTVDSSGRGRLDFLNRVAYGTVTT